ncbi:TPA: hypothetical protein N0F65_001863 [Lagenidium giganteum]|uniref:Protein kinase domain-containing protein n=1 Tax=Lagenidium giganteum TaxID=4803 RepID=A0AAV2YQQ2_9STRA|nr:TPA: hypothetical protein N0F65_001863 [Lagenidium giganteum]
MARKPKPKAKAPPPAAQLLSPPVKWDRSASRKACLSPLSSADEGDAHTAPAKTTKKRATKAKVNPAARKRAKAATTQVLQSDSNGLFTSPPARTSTKELIKAAPLAFVEHLHQQLDEANQSQMSSDFGFGQGYMVRSPSDWDAAQTREFERWLQWIGFTSRSAFGRKHRAVFRIGSLKVEPIVREVNRRILASTDATAEPDEVDDDRVQVALDMDQAVDTVDVANEPTIQQYKQHFQALDKQRLEILTVTEHNRILSSVHHMQIADAMEEVLAQPSLRKERTRARRVSKLVRIAGRRRSIMPSLGGSRMPVLGAPILEDQPWFDEDTSTLLSPIRRKSLPRQQPTIPLEAVRLLLSSGCFPVQQLKRELRCVSHAWRQFAIEAYAWAIGDYSRQTERRNIADLYQSYPRGHYLSDGAYKEVFKVFSATFQRFEAVSVMDVEAIESTGNQHIVQQEVTHSILLSEIVASKACPNFLEIYDIFLCEHHPDAKRWGNAVCRKPVDLLASSTEVEGSVSIKEHRQGLFQYIQMEFCDGGDLEDFISLQESKLLPVHEVVVPFFFQMVFSLYCARERCSLRHCDIKLLNFFLKDIDRRNLDLAGDEPLHLSYGFDGRTFDLSMPIAFSYWVKLADYGTADSNADNLGKPVTLDQFTTLENTPIEFLLEGDLAVQSFAADTFSLGLCLLHLFTGCAPYEEILADVRCPKFLLRDLKAMWKSSKKASEFLVIKKVIQDDPDDVLVHTLYRYLVLLGLPDQPDEDGRGARVWFTILNHLRPGEDSGRRGGRRGGEVSPQLQFSQDRDLFSLERGTNAVIAKARERMADVPGSLELLRKLMAFDPTERPTMKNVLNDPFFSSIQAPRDGTQRTAHYVVDTYTKSYCPDV